MVRTHIVRIGNSRGIRIPKTLLEQCNLTDLVELEVEGGRLLVRPADRPRAGWDEAFARIAAEGGDEPLDEDWLAPTDWELTEWEW